MKKFSVPEKVKVKIFFGYSVTPQFRNALDKSDAWKQAMIVWKGEKNGVCEIKHDGKYYVGRYLEETTLDALRTRENELKKTVLVHCPEIGSQLLSCKVFSQVFVS